MQLGGHCPSSWTKAWAHVLNVTGWTKQITTISCVKVKKARSGSGQIVEILFTQYESVTSRSGQMLALCTCIACLSVCMLLLKFLACDVGQGCYSTFHTSWKGQHCPVSSCLSSSVEFAFDSLKNRRNNCQWLTSRMRIAPNEILDKWHFLHGTKTDTLEIQWWSPSLEWQVTGKKTLCWICGPGFPTGDLTIIMGVWVKRI